jgi:hypothetical protein
MDLIVATGQTGDESAKYPQRNFGPSCFGMSVRQCDALALE